MEVEYFLCGAASVGLGLSCYWHARPDDPPWHKLSSAAAYRIRLCLLRSVAVIFFLLLVACATHVAVKLLIRQQQTGSMLLHDYEWYGKDASALRRFAGTTPRNRSEPCLAPDLVDPPPHRPSMLTAIKPRGGPVRPLRVHVVNLEREDLFPFLWHSILADEHHNDTNANRRSYPELGLELVLVEPPERLLEMPPGSLRNALFIGLDEGLSMRLPPEVRVGTVRKGSESCNNHKPEGLAFSFITYGDCSQVNNREVFVWPLGPSAFHGFPPVINEADLLPADRRSLLLNLLVTHSLRKPTRMQAYMAAQEACDQAGSGLCKLSQTNVLFKLAERLDQELAEFSIVTNFHGHLSTDRYPHQLMQSKLTLCPSGNTPEQYRIWEAIIAGSIPVIEDPVFVPGALHPAMGNSFGCMPDDIHRLLKETNAPVFYVRDWRRDLPAIVREAQDDKALLARQRKLMEWFRRFRTHLRFLLLETMLKKMV